MREGKEQETSPHVPCQRIGGLRAGVRCEGWKGEKYPYTLYSPVLTQIVNAFSLVKWVTHSDLH
jgi:hypothetical protein